MHDQDIKRIEIYLNVCKILSIESEDWEFLVRDRYIIGEIALADLPKALKKSKAEYEKALVQKEAEKQVGDQHAKTIEKESEKGSLLIGKVIPIVVMFFGIAVVLLLVWPPN